MPKVYIYQNESRCDLSRLVKSSKSGDMLDMLDIPK